MWVISLTWMTLRNSTLFYSNSYLIWTVHMASNNHFRQDVKYRYII